ncbi:MAG: hypothetical protein ACOYOF_09215, partial [Verrucomicrobiaceae bacterium]
MIDAIGPFFRRYSRRTINWSKIIYNHLKTQGAGHQEQWARIRADLDTFCANAAAMGYTAVSLDDVTHLADHAWYELETRARIARWSTEFRRCFEIVRRHGLQIYLTMDVFSTTAAVRVQLAKLRWTVEDFLAEVLGNFLQDFPEIAGVIMR